MVIVRYTRKSPAEKSNVALSLPQATRASQRAAPALFCLPLAMRTDCAFVQPTQESEQRWPAPSDGAACEQALVREVAGQDMIDMRK